MPVVSAGAHGAPSSWPRLSGLSGSPGRAIDLAGREARVREGELHVDRAELGGLAGPAKRSLPAKLLELSCVAPPLTCSGVQIGPGATAFTRMPFDASCFASDFT